MIGTFENFKWALRGFLTGGGLSYPYRSAASVVQGQTDFIAYKQTTLISDIVHTSLYLLKELKFLDWSRNRRNLFATLISFPLPFSVQILNHYVDGKKYPVFKKNIIFVRNNLHHLAFIVRICVSFLFVYYSTPIYGVGLIVGLTIELLAENKMMSAKVKAVWEKIGLGISISYLLSVPFIEEEADLFNVFHFLGLILVFSYEHYFQLPHLQQRHQTLDLSTINKLKETKKLKVEWSSIHENPKLAIAGSSHLNIVESMKRMADKIAWTANQLVTFKRGLLNSPRFIHQYPSIQKTEEISDELAKKEFRMGALLVAQEVAYSSIKKGDSYIRYEILQAMFKSILMNLEKDQKEPGFSDDLMRLSLEAGDYCAIGKVAAIEDIYNCRVIGGTETVSLRMKFLHIFNCLRQRWFDSVYARITKYAYKLPKGILDPADIHFRNIALFYFDKGFKLHSETIQNDMTLGVTFYCDHFYRFILTKFLEFTFWPFALKSGDWYAPETLIQEICEASSILGIKGEEIVKWWTNWINKLPSGSDKEKFEDELLMGRVFEKEIYIKSSQGNMQINPEVVKLMLYEMGILKV